MSWILPGVQLARASDLLLKGLDGLLSALRTRALEHKNTIASVDRMASMPSLSPSASSWLRLCRGLSAAGSALWCRKDIATCAVSGAVGTFANIDPRVEAMLRRKAWPLGRARLDEVIPRDRHAMFFAKLAVIASSIERLATEIRHLQRTEVYEARSTSRRVRKARRPCRTSAIRF